MGELERNNVNTDGFSQSLERWLPHLEIGSDETGLPENFKPTRTFRLIVDRLEYARHQKTPLVLVTGAFGAGKSTAIRWYARRDGVVFWECPSSYQSKHVLADIARHLGISMGMGVRMQTSVVINQLQDRPRMFILDEAQRLDYRSMDLLKYIADATHSTFVVCAAPSFENRIDRWDDIATRCHVRVRVAALELDEVQELFGAEGYSSEVLAELHKQTRGIYRVLKGLLEGINLAMRANNMTPEQLKPVHIRKVAERLL